MISQTISLFPVKSEVPLLTPKDLQAELASARIRPAYLLGGMEALLREDCRNAVRTAVLGDNFDAFQCDFIDASTAAASDVLDAVRVISMLGERRYVELRMPGTGKREKILQAVESVVTEQSAQPNDFTCVFVVIAEKVDARASWVKAFKNPAVFVRCDPLKARSALVTFIRGEAKNRGITLGNGVVESLLERAGADLLVLRSELEKLALFVGEKAKVTESHVREVVADIAEEPIWDLTDAIGEGYQATALRVLKRIIDSGAPEPVILGALASHWRKLLRLKQGGEVPGHPFALKKLHSQARRYPLVQLEDGLHEIWEVDEILKGRGQLGPRIALERLVLNLSR